LENWDEIGKTIFFSTPNKPNKTEFNETGHSQGFQTGLLINKKEKWFLFIYLF